MNSRQMKQAMKRMGIAQQDLDAQEVIIKLADKDLIIRNPEVAKVNMMGQETFQIVGEVEEIEKSQEIEITKEDIETVCDQTGVAKEIAEQAIIDANGDLAQAIMSLQEDE